MTLPGLWRVTPARRVTPMKHVAAMRVTAAKHVAQATRAASRGRLGLIALAVCLLPALAACSGAAAQVKLPARAANASAAQNQATAGRQRPVPARQQVIGALTAYTGALSQADRSGSRAEARRLLRPYLAASRIAGLVKAVGAIWASGERFYGQDVLHVLSVRIHGAHAFVHDCDNTSSMGLKNAATGQTVPGSAGLAHANIVTSLKLVKGHWLVQFQLPEDVPCAP